MLSCHKLWFLMMVMVVLQKNYQSWAKPVAQAAGETNGKAGVKDLPKLQLITHDAILSKVEEDNKKVIRVNPLVLPPLKEDSNVSNEDSSVYTIQSLKPYSGKRKYTIMHRSKPQNENMLNDAPIIRGLSLLPNPEKPFKPKHQPKKKHLHFLYNQDDLAGNLLTKTMRVHVAPGAYPVYYVVSNANGRFGKYPLKSFDTSQDFKKFLKKNKLENLPMLETNIY